MPIHSLPYQCQYIARLLSRRARADASDVLTNTLLVAQVDSNPLCRQTQPYVSCTKRVPMVASFTPSQEEQALCDMEADYPRRSALKLLHAGRRQLQRRIFDWRGGIDGQHSVSIEALRFRLSGHTRNQRVFTVLRVIS